MSPALLIIADDLTGANDTGVQFAKQGLDVLVSLRPSQDLQALAHDCQVLVVNTESRHLSPEEAYARVYAVAQQGVALGIPQFYKKTDSTLRGNVGAELAALLAATGEQALFFAPAYPKLKRTTRDGVHFVSGVPLSQTSFAKDVLNPLVDDFIPALLARQTDVPVRIFDEAAAPATQPTIYVVNAETEESLCQAAHHLQQYRVLAGSAGLAEFLPVRAATTITAPRCLSLPVLVVNGSRSEVSLQQIVCASAAGWPVLEARADTTSAQLSALLAQEQGAILTTAPPFCEATPATRMAALVQQTLAQTPLATLIVFGGDTLAAIANACGWTTFRPLTEFLPGAPLVRVGGHEELTLVTKAGGFGGANWLRNVL